MRPAGILSTSWSSAAASTARTSTGVPLRAIACASQDATSATAQAWRTDHAGGSRESSKRAASRRAGTVMPGIVAGAARARGVDRQPVGPQVDHDGPVEVRAIQAGPDVAQACQRRGRRVAVVVAGPHGDEGDAGTRGVQQRGAGRRCAPVVGHLEDVDPGEAAGKQPWVHVVLGVAGEQEATAVRLAEQDDRRVVDAAAGGRGLDGDPGLRPQDRERHLVQAQPGTRRQRGPGRAAPQGLVPRLPARARAVHPGLEDPAYPVPLQDPDEAGDVVLVRMRQDDEVDPAIPRRDAGIELHQQPLGVRPAVHQHPAAGPALDEDRVALPDIEHHEAGRPARGVGQGERRERDDDRRQRTPGRGWQATRGPACAGASGASGAARRRWPASRSPRRVAPGPGARSRVSPAPARRPRAPPPARPRAGSRRRRTARPAAIRTTATMTCSSSQPGSPRTVATSPGEAEHRQGAAGHRQDARTHRRGDQRHDREVHRRGHQREPPERHEHVRERRRLRRERDAQALGEPAGDAPARQPADPARRAACPRRAGPAVAATERRKPASPIIAGSATSIANAASASAAGARPARPDSRASSTTPAITAARTTDGDAPAAST